PVYTRDDLHHGPASDVTRYAVLLGLVADVGGQPAISGHPADGRTDQHQDDQQHRQRAAQRGVLPGGPAASVPGRALLVLGRLLRGDLVERGLLVAHPSSSSSAGPSWAASVSVTSSPARAPVDRSMSSACWRIITA